MQTKGFIFFITLCISFMLLCCNSQDRESTNTDLDISYDLNSKEGLAALAKDDELLKKLLSASAWSKSATSSSVEEICTGDVNCDSRIDLVDVALITLYYFYPTQLNYYLNVYNVTFDTRYADVDRDGDIDLDDAQLVVAYWHGKIKIFPGERIIFDDPNLEQAIRELIGIESGDIYYGDVNYITSVSFNYREIAKITVLKYFTSLIFLSITNNQITSLDGLDNFTKLECLYIEDNNINNINALMNISSLKVLYAKNNEINDISALKNMSKLECLDLDNNQIESIPIDLSLDSLYWLILSNNIIWDISGMEFMPLLYYVNLTNNYIENITPLVNNLGVGLGDFVGLTNNPVLEITEQQANIQILLDRGAVVR